MGQHVREEGEGGNILPVQTPTSSWLSSNKWIYLQTSFDSVFLQKDLYRDMDLELDIKKYNIYIHILPMEDGVCKEEMQTLLCIILRKDNF